MIPLFPLPNVVLFPGVFLPLHIFESRYREMVRDALAGDRIIGMVLLRGTTDPTDGAAPPVYEVGCSGLITHAEPLSDGRFNIVLRGLERFRILAEDHTRAYRRARTAPIPELATTGADLHVSRMRLEALLDRRPSPIGSESRIPRGIGDEDLVNALSQYLELDPVEKQALLERNGPVARCRSLIDLLEMKAMMHRMSSSATTVQ